MTKYIGRRLLQYIPTLFLASIALFALIQLSGGDPARMMLGPEATEEMVQAERIRMGLDKPAPVRYLIWLADVARLNLGHSLTNGRPVVSLIGNAFPNTVRLTMAAFLFSLVTGIPLGVLCALKQNKLLDSLITAVNSLALALPSFWLGILMILLFSVRLRWLPPSGAGEAENSFFENLRYLVMPMMSIGFGGMAIFSRFVRSALIDTLAADYVRTARAKGLAERAVIVRHALRNALIPVVTILGMSFAGLLGGAVVTESVFAYSGMGRLVITAIMNRDYPVVQGSLMLVVLIFLCANLIVDLSYAYLDPRVRLT